MSPGGTSYPQHRSEVLVRVTQVGQVAPWHHWEKEVTYKFLGTPSDEPEPAGARTVSFENPWLHLCLKKRWLKCGENHPLHEGLSVWKRGKPLKFPLKKKKILLYNPARLPRWLTCKCRKCSFDPWVGKIFWRKDWQFAPVFLLGKFNGQRSLVVYGVTKSQSQLSQGNRYIFQQTVKWQTPLEVECTVVWGSEVRQAGFHWALCHF